MELPGARARLQVDGSMIQGDQKQHTDNVPEFVCQSSDNLMASMNLTFPSDVNGLFACTGVGDGGLSRGLTCTTDRVD
jgi:hypothetical protein